jgi:hypothetical protein
MTLITALRFYNLVLLSNAPRLFQTIPTISNCEAHRTYLNLRLIDYINDKVPLTLSYSSALIKYQKAVEHVFWKP